MAERTARALALALALLLTATALPVASARTVRSRDPNALHGRAMWIWQLERSSDGELPAVVAQAHRFRITTLIVKSSDGIHAWRQFSPGLVAALHAAGLHVCAWQYVYGDHPGVEANLGADAAREGADCLIVDAESQYDGHYVAAQAFVRDLRKQIGAGYPVGLTGLAYVDEQPAFPYSVFLGPGGAQYDLPQMYWRDIGSSVGAVFARTYAFNLPYGRPIYPLGQLYANPPVQQIMRFRELARDYQAPGVSWWDWQQAGTREWDALADPTPAGAVAAAVGPVIGTVGDGASGDLVLWIQEHLVAAGYPVKLSGDFGSHTLADIEAFQAARGLSPDGLVGPATWAALLRYRPVAVRWVHAGRRTVAAQTIPRSRA